VPDAELRAEVADVVVFAEVEGGGARPTRISWMRQGIDQLLGDASQK
jgi:hypothetical protein